MRFIIVCHTDHSPTGGQAAGWVRHGEFGDEESAVEELARIGGLYPGCDMSVEEVS